MPLAISVVPSIGSTATSHSGPLPVADLLAVVEHGRLVLLALADDDDALHAHRADQRAHGVDRRAVAAVLVAAAHPAAGGHGGRLGHPDQLEGQVAVGRRAVGAGMRGRVVPTGAGSRDRAATRDLLSRAARRLGGQRGASCPAILGA